MDLIWFWLDVFVLKINLICFLLLVKLELTSLGVRLDLISSCLCVKIEHVFF